jgi:site-specific recombinase XerD
LKDFDTRQLLRVAHKQAGLEKVYGWHSYRHYAARHYRLQSADIFDVQKLLGHKQISTTVGAYGNYIPDDLAGKHERHTALNTLLEQKGI